MITLPNLKTAMLDILHEIRGTEIKLILVLDLQRRV